MPPTSRHWTEIARRWELVGPPLRPCPQDIAVYAQVVAERARAIRAPLRALILGVTPEIYRMAWPQGTRLVAVDHTPGMIHAVWPGPRGRAVCGDWTALPFATASRDVALCDGGFQLLAHPRSQTALVRELRRVVAPGGSCVLRLFVPPAERESPDVVLADLLAARISSVDILKLRLGMALCPDPVSGVRLAHIWDALHAVAPDPDRVAGTVAWPPGSLRVIDTYRDCPTTYHFTSLDEVRRLFCEAPGGFEVASIHEPDYERGERFPILVLRRVAS